MSKFVKLSSVATLTVGFVGTMAKHYTETGVPLLRSLNVKPFKIIGNDMKYVSEEFSNSISKSILHEGDVIIVRTGIPGTCCVVPAEYNGCNCSDVVIVHPNTALVDPHYLAAFINIWGQRQVQNNKVGAIQQHFNVHSAEEMLIFLPNLDEQKRIASVIVALNSKIENNNAICSGLESMAKTIYDYWFMQFDFPDADGKPYRSSGGAMEWNEQLKRQIPKDWDIGNLGSLGTITSGGTPSTSNKSYYTENGIAWITPNDLSGKEHNLFFSHGERDITRNGLNNSSAVLMPRGTVLFSSRAPIGYIAISENEVCSNQGFKSIVPDKGFGSFFVYYTVKRNTPAIAKQGVGTTFKEVSRDTMERFKIVLPPVSITDQFENILHPMFEKRRALEHENMELTKLRDWLLPMIMNGQATVADAEQEVSKVIHFAPQTVEVRQAARNFSDKKTDDTADLVKAFMRRKQHDTKA